MIPLFFTFLREPTVPSHSLPLNYVPIIHRLILPRKGRGLWGDTVGSPKVVVKRVSAEEAKEDAQNGTSVLRRYNGLVLYVSCLPISMRIVCLAGIR